MKEQHKTTTDVFTQYQLDKVRIIIGDLLEHAKDGGEPAINALKRSIDDIIAETFGDKD